MYKTEFVQMLGKYRFHHPTMREGQAVFNLLYEIFPTEVDPLRGSLIDPFYNDDNIPAFLEKLGI